MIFSGCGVLCSLYFVGLDKNESKPSTTINVVLRILSIGDFVFVQFLQALVNPIKIQPCNFVGSEVEFLFPIECDFHQKSLQSQNHELEIYLIDCAIFCILSHNNNKCT